MSESELQPRRLSSSTPARSPALIFDRMSTKSLSALSARTRIDGDEEKKKREDREETCPGAGRPSERG